MIDIGRLACWRRSPTGVWLIWGRHDILEAADRDATPVAVRNRHGDVSHQLIERVTAPNADGFAYAWPVGTTKPTTKVTELPTVAAPEPHNVVRPRKGRAAKASIARRSARAKHRR